MLFVVALVLVPFWFWQGTWFGRRLKDPEIARYLADAQKPRHVQHALSQIADAIVRGDASVKRWYPQVVALAGSPVTEVRVTAAWVMGQDNRDRSFHQTLLELLNDREPMVQRNAALALVRFGDAQGKLILGQMLRPYTVTAPRAGVFSPRLKAQDPVNIATLLGRISTAGGELVEMRSPLPGQVKARLRKEGAQVAPGDPLIDLDPAPEQVWEALRAFYLVGSPDDLPDVERFTRPLPGMPDKVQQQARLTAQAIRRRASPHP